VIYLRTEKFAPAMVAFQEAQKLAPQQIEAVKIGNSFTNP